MPRACSALAGTEMPNMPNTEASFAELKARVTKAVDYVKGFKPAQIDGTEDKEITLKLGANERKFTGQGLLLNFILPNFYFHCTTAYDILRHCGIELGKRDFMGTPVTCRTCVAARNPQRCGADSGALNDPGPAIRHRPRQRTGYPILQPPPSVRSNRSAAGSGALRSPVWPRSSITLAIPAMLISACFGITPRSGS